MNAVYRKKENCREKLNDRNKPNLRWGHRGLGLALALVLAGATGGCAVVAVGGAVVGVATTAVGTAVSVGTTVVTTGAKAVKAGVETVAGD